MDVVWHKMQRYRFARKLMSPPAIVADVFDVEVRSKVEGQHRLALEVSRYGNAVVSALRALLTAHEALELHGLDTSVRRPVFAQTQRLREAVTRVQATFESCAAAATGQAQLFASCMSHLEKADKLAAEERWYKQKMEALTGEDVVDFDDDEDSSGPARLVRNRSKLARTHKEAGAAQAQASTALDACITRVPKLQGIVRDMLAGTEDALRVSAGVLNPFDSDLEENSDDELPNEMHSSIAAPKRRTPPRPGQELTLHDCAMRPEVTPGADVTTALVENERAKICREAVKIESEPAFDMTTAPSEEESAKISREGTEHQLQGGPGRAPGGALADAVAMGSTSTFKESLQGDQLKKGDESPASTKEPNSVDIMEKEVPALELELPRGEADQRLARPRKIRALQLHKLLAGWSKIPEQVKREDSSNPSVEGRESHEPESEVNPEWGQKIAL